MTILFIQNNLILYVQYVLELEEWFPYFLFVLLGTTVLSLPLWTVLSKWMGKKKLLYVGIGALTLTLCVPFFLPEGKEGEMNFLGLGLFFLLSFVAGFQLGVVFLIPSSMFPDVIELDELVTGERREGLLSAFFVFFQKLALAGALAVSNYVLSFAGYISSTDDNQVKQPASVLFALKLMVGFVPAGVLLFSLIPLYFYPITKEKHRKTLTLLQEQRKLRKKKKSTIETREAN